MAAACHARSISLPSRSHPLNLSVEGHLRRLKASEANSFCSSSSICQNLGVLNNLFEDLDNLLQMPLTQQALSREQHGKWVEEVLDGSLGLFDVCGTSKDVLSLTKECVQELESSLRRRRGGESGHAIEVQNFMIMRKKVNKMVQKCFENLKKMERKCYTAILEKNNDDVVMATMLREVEMSSLSVFASLLSIVSAIKARSKPNGWSLVSKLIPSKRVACESLKKDINEVEKIEIALDALKREKSSKINDSVQAQNVLKQLEVFELRIRELEEGLECLFRHLIKTRVSLLNILNH